MEQMLFKALEKNRSLILIFFVTLYNKVYGFAKVTGKYIDAKINPGWKKAENVNLGRNF